MDKQTEQFYAGFSAYMDWLMEQRPVLSTLLGTHKHEDRLADFSLSSLENAHRMNQQYLPEFEAGLSSTDKDAKVDAALAVSMVKGAIRSYEHLLHRSRMPDMYVDEVVFGPYTLLAKDFAPLPERLNNLIGRLSDIPRILEQAKTNLERPPKIWTEIAMDHARGGISFYENTVPSIASHVPELASRVSEASNSAADALREFLHYVESDLLPRSDGEFPVGEKLWNEMVHEEQMLDSDADQIERMGHRLIAETRDEMAEIAETIEPGKDLMEVMENLRKLHPEPDKLLDVYRNAMHASRQFIIDKNLVTIPDGESLEIEETPAFARPTLPFAAYLSPGPFEVKQQGVFWVTPVDPDLPDVERETRLRGHPSKKIPVIAVHEGYPGHHLQLVRSNKASTLPRKIVGSTLFIEGWAFYCEEMMEKNGFLTDPASRLLRLADQLWRACRIVIDVGIHTRGMSVEEAIKMLVQVAGLKEPNAIAEVHRYTQSPTQPMCYLIGKLEILKIADDYKLRKGSSFDLKTFHDELLSFGSLAPRLIRTMLFD